MDALVSLHNRFSKTWYAASISEGICIVRCYELAIAWLHAPILLPTSLFAS